MFSCFIACLLTYLFASLIICSLATFNFLIFSHSYLLICLPNYLVSFLFGCLLTCLLVYLLTCLLAYLLTCLLAYLITCLVSCLVACLLQGHEYNNASGCGFYYRNISYKTWSTFDIWHNRQYAVTSWQHRGDLRSKCWDWVVFQ